MDQLIAKAAGEPARSRGGAPDGLRREGHIRSARAAGLPTLGANGSVNRTYYYNRQGTAPYANNYAGTILFRFPVFTGFNRTYEILKAKEQAEAAHAQVEVLADQVILQVWTSYYNVKTAAARVKTARDLLASASQSQDVALERYKAGVGNILDLLTAQTAFASARAQEVQARASWFLAVAQLAHDTGSFRLRPARPPRLDDDERNR